MNGALDRLLGTRGVRAAAAYDPAGHCVASTGDAALTKALDVIGPDLVNALAPSGGSFTGNASLVITRFESGTLVVRRNARALLAVVCDARVDMSDAGANVPIQMAFTILGTRIASRRPPPTNA